MCVCARARTRFALGLALYTPFFPTTMVRAAKDSNKKGAVVATDDSAPKPAMSAEMLTVADIGANVALVRKGVVQGEARFSWRVVRGLGALRKKLNDTVLAIAVKKYFPRGGSNGEGSESDDAAAARADALVTSYLDAAAAAAAAASSAAMDTSLDEEEGSKSGDEEGADKKAKVASSTTTDLVPVEVELYLHLLVVMHLIDSERSSSAVTCAEALIKRVSAVKRRTADILAARAYFYFARAHELQGNHAMIRSTLHAAYRTAAMRCDEPGQAVLLNLLLRSYLADRLVSQAELLVSKSTFPESAPNSEMARYLYYLGRIKAIQLDYSEAGEHLFAAIRKAPAGAVGFLQHAHKLAVVVKMLLGEIPARDTFRQPILERPLAPYFAITQAVRQGDLGLFNAVLEQHTEKFKADDTYTLILRLRQSVIKAGVRIICLSYSRISLEAIATKLQLDSTEDAEYIVAKCIRDGVIEATIDHDGKFVASKDVVDVYATGEPLEAFHQRISFCLKMHNDSVKSMQYPPNAYRKYLETPEQRREREMLDIELAEEIAKEEEEEEGGGGL